MSIEFMRKDLLFLQLGHLENSYILPAPKLLNQFKAFLKTPAIRLRNGNENISLEEFRAYLKSIGADTQIEKRVNFRDRSFFSNIIGKESHWNNFYDAHVELTELGYNHSENILKLELIKDYKSFLNTLKKVAVFYSINSLTELDKLLLSGEPRAIDYALNHLEVTPKYQNSWGANCFQLVALSGNLFGMEFLLDKIYLHNSLHEDKNGRVLCHYAAWSGNLQMLRSVVLNEQIDNYSSKDLQYYLSKDTNTQSIYAPTDQQGKSIRHYALLSGNIDLYNYVVFALDIENYDISDSITEGTCAALSGSTAVIKKIFHSRLDKANIDKNGNNVLHHAICSGSYAAVKYAIQELKIDPAQKDYLGRTSLQLACRLPNTVITDYLLRHFSNKLNPEDKDNQNNNAYAYARLSTAPESMILSLNNFARVKPEPRNSLPTDQRIVFKL